MPKMRDVGEKDRFKSHEAPMASEKRIWYPSIRLDTKQLPELKGCKMNDKVTMVLEGTIKGIDQHNQNPANYSIDILKAGISKKPQAGVSKLAQDLLK